MLLLRMGRGRLGPLAQGLAGLAKGLGKGYEDTVIVVMSEFGRTVRENGNRGTDHGHGTVYWVLGGGIRGGTVYGASDAKAMYPDEHPVRPED